MTKKSKDQLVKALKTGSVRAKLKSNKSLTDHEKFILFDFLGYKENLRKNYEIEEMYQDLGQDLSLKETA